MFKVSGKGYNLSSTDQKAMNSMSPSNFTFLMMWSVRQKLWWFLSGTELPRGTWLRHATKQHQVRARLLWPQERVKKVTEAKRSFQGCLKITRFSWTLSQSVMFLQGILALTYFTWNQNIIVVIFLLESRNVCELLSERHKQISLKVGDIEIRTLI